MKIKISADIDARPDRSILPHNTRFLQRRRNRVPEGPFWSMREGMRIARQIRNLALSGFMGTGKSSAGRLVASQLRFEFVDTDALIEGRAGKPIPEIFAQDGEAAFRALEREVVDELGGRSGLVISTGGGLASNPENLASLKSHALVVCLWASPETIFERTRHAANRPLLRSRDPLRTIRELLAQREPVYRQADALVNTELRSMREVAQQVLLQFQLARQQPPTA